VRFWAEDGTPLDFGHELFGDDIERIEDNMMRAIDRVPALGQAGIKRVINGPMIWSPDSNALFGPVPELKGYFCCNGIIPGFSQSGGLGQLSAEWIVTGEPHLDMFPWDLSRFGSWADNGSIRFGLQTKKVLLIPMVLHVKIGGSLLAKNAKCCVTMLALSIFQTLPNTMSKVMVLLIG